jgi:uncharacterized protein YkwD
MRTPALLAILAIFSLPHCGWGQVYASGAERQLFAAANRERQERGLSALQWNEALANAARRHAMEMANRGVISHQFPGEPSMPVRATRAGVHFSALAENVALAPTPLTIHDLWMHSPPHRANLLDKDMDSIGIGTVQRNGEVFAVEDFCSVK